MSDNGHKKDISALRKNDYSGSLDNFVLEKDIFTNVFEKDIRRVYIYKKAERLAKAIHLVTPAFTHSPALRNRVDAVAVALVDAATLPPGSAREALSRELLALSSVLSIARTSGILSIMNAEMIAREAHALLGDIAAYEEPRVFLEDAPTLAALAKRSAAVGSHTRSVRSEQRTPGASVTEIKDSKRHVSDSSEPSTRRGAILSVLETKGPSYIKDISTVVRGVSEKTIQRELSALVLEGVVRREGERRWTTYTLAR